MKKIFVYTSLLLIIFLSSCKKDFLSIPPQGQQTGEFYYTKSGAQKALDGAYHSLTGITAYSGWWSTSGTNWVYGDITSGDAYTGGPNPQDQASVIEQFQTTANLGWLEENWQANYDGVARANTAIINAQNATDMTDAEKTEIYAEAKFLRAHFHFNNKIIFNNIPYVDEEVTKNVTFTSLSNTTDVWPNIEADFKYAYDNLPETQSSVGRANKWAAACYIAKCYMFQKKYDSALTLLNTIMASGKTSSGTSYDLVDCFHDNFDASTENNKESVFQIQFSVDDNSFGYNSNLGETGCVPSLGYGPDPYYGYWKRPSFNLVNAFKTDIKGLPMLDASGNDTSNVTNMTNDMGLPSYSGFIPYQGTVDPRLDWSVGRCNVPYLDWGVNPGQDWAGYSSGQLIGGPYVPMKNVYMASQDYGIGGNNYYAAGGAGSSVNYSIIRYAEVLLWAAECEVEVGNLEKARMLVNRVRNRAKNGCTVYIDYSTGYPSANYFVDAYNTAWSNQDFARNAVRFETRIELALEGHRFFDLVRWGIAGDYINKYLQTEQTRIDHLKGTSFTANKNEYFPIPQYEINLDHNLVQNPGY